MLSLPLAGGPRERKHLLPVEGLFSPEEVLLPAYSGYLQREPSFNTSSDNHERNIKQKWNSNDKDYVRKKPIRHAM